MTKSVLVTGAGTGLGLETALYLASKGAVVYASVLDDSQRQHVANQAAMRKLPLHIVDLDVTDDQSIEAAINLVVAETGGLYGLVNNAGISLRGYFEDTDDDEIRRVFDVNLFGAMAVTRTALPHMRKARRGRIIFVSSIAGRIGSMARTTYCASKFALEGFAESLMQEVVPLGLHVSIIEPAIIKTERWTVHRGVAKRALDPQGPYYAWFCREEELADRLVQSSQTTPLDVAQTVYKALTLSRPKLRYIVGPRARIVLALRRYLPGELFEQIWFGEAMRRVTRSSVRVASLATKV